MISNRVAPAAPKLAPHVAKLLSWRGAVADDDVPDAEDFKELRPRTIPIGAAPGAYAGGWISANLSHPELQKDGHTR